MTCWLGGSGSVNGQGALPNTGVRVGLGSGHETGWPRTQESKAPLRGGFVAVGVDDVDPLSSVWAEHSSSPVRGKQADRFYEGRLGR